jgi:acetyl esterase/lipase
MHVLSRLPPTADARIPYGSDPSQFGDLWLPHAATGQSAPLVIFFHGGWWKSEYDLAHAGHLCKALREDGIAVWSVEYRRVGATGGGWPATFQDAAAGMDYVETLLGTYPIDGSRVITVGHSAGGHLAFWAAGRHNIGLTSEIYAPPKVPLIGAIALAGAVDLRLLVELAVDPAFAHDRRNVYSLMGGEPELFPERYKAGNPGELLPFHVPQTLIQGSNDDQIPPDLPTAWERQSLKLGDDASVTRITSADHFDLIDPESPAWQTVRRSVRTALRIG